MRVTLRQRRHHPSMKGTPMTTTADTGSPPAVTVDDHSGGFTELDDTELLSRRAEMRAELERLPPASSDYDALTALYDKSTEEVNHRAREAWSGATRESGQ